MRLRNCILVVAIIVWSLGGALRTAAAADASGGPTPPRLSFLDGEVSFWRPGAEDWAPAKTNMPLAPGDSLYTGDNANVELQLAPRALVRGGAGTQIGLESLENGYVQLKVTAGHLALDLRERDLGETIEVDTPQGAFTIDRPGYYRVEVDENRTTFLTRRDGAASVIPAGGEQTDVGPDQQVVLEGNDEHAELTSGAAPAPDDWDKWNLERTDSLGEAPKSARYLPRGVSGGDDLDRNGSWHDEPEYGPVWTPSAVTPDWAPYTTGHWVWDPYYGWSWIDDAPWGWAPFHYGRWVSVGGGWGWAPGPVAVAPVYSPALVAFFGAPGVGVSVSVGVPFVSWVALGFGEPLIPWWGPPAFIGHCWWGGWGGPHIVNNVVIQKNVFVNVNRVNVYKNVSVQHAVVRVNRDQFGRPGAQHVRVSEADARNLRPVRGNLGVHPTPQSLVPAAGRGRRPPDAVRARPVVATRAPQDPSPHLRASGLNAGPAHVPPPRIVQPTRGPRGGGGAGRAQGPAGAAPGAATAPPPPHAPTRGPEGRAVTPQPARPQGQHPGHAAPRGPAAERTPPHAPAVERPTPQQPAAERPRGGGGSHAPAPQGGAVPRTERRPSPHAEPSSPPRGSQGGAPREERVPPAATHPAPAPGYPRGGNPRGGYQGGGGSRPAGNPRAGSAPGAVHPAPAPHPARPAGHQHERSGASMVPRRSVAAAGFPSQLRAHHAAPGSHRG